MTARADYRTRQMVITCNRCFSVETQEKFYLGMPFIRISEWLRRNSWKIEHVSDRLFRHYCPSCVPILKTSEDYQRRIHA